MKNSTACFIFVGIVLVLLASGGHGKSSVSASSSGNVVVQQIDTVFGVYGSQAEAIARCESSLNPGAYNPEPVWVNGVAEHAQGLFQIIPSTFAGVSNGNVYNAGDNIEAAHRIFIRDGYSWREWQCQP